MLLRAINASGTGELDRFAKKSAHSAGHGESNLAASFRHGLVSTPSEFGTHGQEPTHPELLDWLASEFIARGWSIKQMHRLMLTSATYRQSSQAPASKIDPNNKLYSRMNRLRLEGEVIRDSLLAISGQLNPASKAPVFFLRFRPSFSKAPRLDARIGSARLLAPQHLYLRAAQSAVSIFGSVRRARYEFELPGARAQHDGAAIPDIAQCGRSHDCFACDRGSAPA
jgi:hypothetical protein